MVIDKLINYSFMDRDTIKVYPIGDVHLGAVQCNESAWRQFVTSLANDPDAYIVLLGDLVDNATKNSVASLYDVVMSPMDQKKAMVKYLEPLRDKILAITTGNHEARSYKESGVDLTEDIAIKLDLENRYRREICYVKVGVGKRSDGWPQQCYNMVITHGAGGGSLTGAGINRTERFSSIIEGVDIFISGHSHKPAVTKPRRLVIDTRTNSVVERDTVVLTASSWLSYGGYAAAKMLVPSSSCNPQCLTLYGKTDKKRLMTVTW